MREIQRIVRDTPFSNDSFALSIAYINWETDAIVGIELIRNSVAKNKVWIEGKCAGINDEKFNVPIEFVLSAPLLRFWFKQNSRQNQSHLSTTWLWFYLWFCLVINFNKCVPKLSYQNWFVLRTTSNLGSVSSCKLIRAKAKTQTEPECLLKKFWFCG